MSFFIHKLNKLFFSTTNSLSHCNRSIITTSNTNTFNKLLYVFDVAGLGRREIVSAVNNILFDDLEDSMQNEASVSSSLDYIVTRNKSDFEKSSIPAVSPEEFLILVHSKS